MNKYLFIVVLILAVFCANSYVWSAEPCCLKKTCACVKTGCCVDGKCACKSACCTEGNCKCTDAKCSTKCNC